VPWKRRMHVAATMAAYGRWSRTRQARRVNALPAYRGWKRTPNVRPMRNHGRPTYVELKLSDIERLFGRADATSFRPIWRAIEPGRTAISLRPRREAAALSRWRANCAAGRAIGCADRAAGRARAPPNRPRKTWVVGGHLALRRGPSPRPSLPAHAAAGLGCGLRPGNVGTNVKHQVHQGGGAALRVERIVLHKQRGHARAPRR